MVSASSRSRVEIFESRCADVVASRRGRVIKSIGDAQRMVFNDYLDAGVTAFFMVAVVVILADSIREWTAVLRGHKPAVSSEAPFEAVPVPGD